MSETRRPTASVPAIFSARSDLTGFVASAVLLSLGVNLIASGLVQFFEISDLTQFCIGFAVAFAVVLLFTLKLLPHRKRHHSIAGVIAILDPPRDVLEIPRYTFAEECARIFAALCAESRAMAATWRTGPLTWDGEGAASPNDKRVTAPKLIEEAVEYFVLETLSTHLTDYFNEIDTDKAKSGVITITRKDVPGVLLENRFLELFSKPMDQRDSFLGQTMSPGDSLPPTETVVYAHSPTGAIFSHFELVLPRKSRIIRVDRRTIEITTQMFQMRIAVAFPGFSEVLPEKFESLYMRRDRDRIEVFEVSINISVKFQLRAFFSSSGWKFHRWVDSFIDTLDQEASIERFLEKIGWQQALTAAMATEAMLMNARPSTPTGNLAETTPADAPLPEKRVYTSGPFIGSPMPSHRFSTTDGTV